MGTAAPRHAPDPRWAGTKVLANVEGVAVWWLALVVLLPAAAIALSRGFDGLYGQDAFAYFDYSVGPLREALLSFAPLPPFFWPPGYPLLVALVSLVLGPTPLAGQFVSLLMGALVPVLTALLARELFPRDRALPLIAGALAGLCSQVWQSSYVVMADTTGLALATLGAWAAVRHARQRVNWWLVLASAALAWALLARWIYGLVAVPVALHVLTSQPRLKDVLLAVLAIGIILLPTLGPGLVGLATRPGEAAAFAGNLQVYSWSPVNALLKEFDTPDGHLSYALPNGLYYAAAPGSPALFGPLLAPLTALGLWRALRSWSRHTLILVFGWAAVVFAFHAGAPWQNIRFTLAYVPPLAILIAVSLVWLWQRLPAPAVAAYALAGLAVMLIGSVRLNESFVDRQMQDRQLVVWVETQVEPNASLVTFGPTLTFTHYSRIPTQDLFEVDVTRVPSGSYVLVDVANVEQQWSGQPPGVALAHLRQAPGLDERAQHGSFTLYRLR